MNILLIAGGWSEERDVSLRGAGVLEAALLRLGHKVKRFDPEHSFDGLFEAVAGQDFAFINLHGAPGEDGLPQSLLEIIGLPYQGSGPAGSFIALDKAAAKAVFRRAGLPTPEWHMLPRRPAAEWEPAFTYPVFVKKNTGGSSLGLVKAHNRHELAAALDGLFAGGDGVIVEPACAGQELTCAVLAELEEKDGLMREKPLALPPILIRPLRNTEGIFDYASKYAASGAEELCPAPLPQPLLERAGQYALAAHRALGLRGYSRTDFILGADGSLTILEINTLPGMTEASLLPKAAAAAGLDFDQLIRRLLDLGLAAHRSKPRPGTAGTGEVEA
ncbi:MAG: D-alanine--D-alanine ligase [Deltaproteobacteria bacterium]|jgi:D-alanine-D-alanine ligase|nr:D-alanine--D-alanine ligase [Deltaproteobacteria bacterium]